LLRQSRRALKTKVPLLCRNISDLIFRVEKVFGEILVDNECKLTESSSSIVFCRAQDSGYLIENKIYAKKVSF
jgi:hypothetical protein